MKRQRKHLDLAIIVIGIFLAGVVVGAFLLPFRATVPETPVQLASSSQVVIGIPAVDTSGEGVLGKLTTEVKPGTGKVLVNVVNVITLGDTQQSAQKAVKAAGSFTNLDLGTTDVIFNIDVNATSIEGPSAGSSMAVSIVFGLRNETPRSDVMTTGIIDENGRIGRVGSIFEKAKSAKSGGATVFVVPEGQAVESQTTRTRQCRQIGSTQHCRVSYESTQVNIGDKLNLTIAEAGTLEEAVRYFKG
ncbi:MAG: hypothetical protein HY514_04355 [Candidatus Aenigmarchaeota archaeon]|nr:hypothetical protein [Candidatus Aenigmarchaeota archaeon]